MAGEYAGIVALDDVHGSLSASLGGFVASEGAVNVHMSTGEDLSVYAFGNVHGRYHAGRDASVMTYGSFSGSLTADRDIGSGHYDHYGVPGVWARDSRVALAERARETWRWPTTVNASGASVRCPLPSRRATAWLQVTGHHSTLAPFARSQDS